jgi:putative transposase
VPALALFKALFADRAYDRGRLVSLTAYRDFQIEIVRKVPGQQGFQRCRAKWSVERTFGWMMRWCQLVRNYEERCDVPDAVIGCR